VCFLHKWHNSYVVENCMEKERKIKTHQLKYNQLCNIFVIISVNEKNKAYKLVKNIDYLRHFYGNF
jgi:transcription antitermination factor NusG